MTIRVIKKEKRESEITLSTLKAGQLFRFSEGSSVHLVIKAPKEKMIVNLESGVAGYFVNWQNQNVVILDGELSVEEVD